MRITAWLVCLALVSFPLAILACSGAPQPTPTPTLAPFIAATPTVIPTPTRTPNSALTPMPIATIAPTLAAFPTSRVTPTAIAPQPRTLKGVSLSPKSFSSADFTDFFQKATKAGSLVSWAGDWNELAGTTGGPAVVAELASTYRYSPVVVAQFFSQSSGRLLRPMDTATMEAYKKGAVAFAQKYRPPYLALGIEVNLLHEKSPADFDLFVGFFREVYTAVKSVSPNTKVFTVFQLEKMKGLGGGLFGGENDPSRSQWPLLDKFPDSDIIAFTTYPGLIYKDPAEIPPDYYAEIRSRTSKRIAFTEVGWHSAASPTGWESSEAEQGRFVKTFFNLTGGLDKEMVIWSFLYDQTTIEPFKSMGLLRGDRSASPAWEEWLLGM